MTAEGDDERNDFEETHKIQVSSGAGAFNNLTNDRPSSPTQAGIFSVLYILSKEKMNENLKFTIIKVVAGFC